MSIKNPRKQHKKTLIEYIVYASDNGVVRYWTGEEWSITRAYAKSFDDIASANTIAEREGGKAVKR